MLTLFLIVDGLFVVGLVWWLWTRRARENAPRTTTPIPSDTQETHGAPAALVPPVRRIGFEGNSAALSPQAIADLDALAGWLKTNAVRLEVTGSADDSGHLTRNRQLAQARSAVAQRALLAHGIASDRLAVCAVEPVRGVTDRERQALRCVSFAVR